MVEAVEVIGTGEVGGRTREGDQGPSQGHKWSTLAREKWALRHGALHCRLCPP